MAVILKRKLVFQYEKNSKINILSDNFRVLAWKFSTSFRKINSFVAVVYFFYVCWVILWNEMIRVAFLLLNMTFELRQKVCNVNILLLYDIILFKSTTFMLNLILYINASKFAIVLELHVPKRTPFFSFFIFLKNLIF